MPMLCPASHFPLAHVSVSSLLHAMAVVPGADETILGAAPGSAFPGNSLGTRTTSGAHSLGTRASESVARAPQPLRTCLQSCFPSPIHQIFMSFLKVGSQDLERKHHFTLSHMHITFPSRMGPGETELGQESHAISPSFISVYHWAKISNDRKT